MDTILFRKFLLAQERFAMSRMKKVKSSQTNIFGTFVFVSELRFSSKNKNPWQGKPNFIKTSRKTPQKIKFYDFSRLFIRSNLSEHKCRIELAISFEIQCH